MASDIQQQVTRWVDAGLIEPAQGDAIIAHERAAAPATPAIPAVPTEPRNRIAGSLGTVGGLLVGLGVLLSVAANWSNIGDTAKVVTLIIGMLIAYGIALAADARGAQRWIGTAGYTVGVLIFAGGVFLLGQLFNVRAHVPLGFLVIAITASVIAVLSARRLVGGIAAAAWIAWAIHELALSLLNSSDEQTVAGLLGGGVLLGIAAMGIGWSLNGIAERARAGSVHADLSVLGVPLLVIAQLGLLGLLVPVSYGWHAESGGYDGALPIGQLLIGATLVAVSVLALARFGVIRARRIAAVVLAGSAALVLLVVLVADPFLAGLLANLLLAVGGVGLGWLGLAEDRADAYAWGVAWIIVLIAARYVDVMVTSELGGLGFIGAGLLLIGCAWLVGRSRTIWQERDA